jgi:predicted HTH transcriptional regulator
MMELTTASGLPEPEFVNTNHSFTVRFLPSRYVAPTRVETSLSSLQQEILQALGKKGPLTFGDLSEALPSGTARRTLQDNLRLMRAMGIVEMEGERRWAYWRLAASDSKP